MSELEYLLEKGAYGNGLNEEEKTRALLLIETSFSAEEDCQLCLLYCPNNIQKAIDDSDLCREHAMMII